jgi:hypothetical protein
MTIKEAIITLGNLKNVPADPFFQKAGIRLFILKNEGKLGKYKNPQIQRAKLWNLQKQIWLEIEDWGIETHDIETKIQYIGTLNTLDKPLDLTIKEEFLWESNKNKKQGILQKIITSEISTIIIQSILNNTETIPITQENPSGQPPPIIHNTPKNNGEPYVFFDFPDVCHTLMQFGEKLNPENTLTNLIEEEKEGVDVKMQYLMQQNPNNSVSLMRKTYESAFTTVTSATIKPPIPLNKRQHCFIPLDTLLTLLEEQMTWAPWLTRTKPTPLDVVDMARFIHKSADYQKIFNYFRKNQKQDWEQTIMHMCRQNLMALMLSAATIPPLNERLSNKINRFQIKDSIFWVIHQGGLLNKTLLKNAWIFGVTKTFKTPENHQLAKVEELQFSPFLTQKRPKTKQKKTMYPNMPMFQLIQPTIHPITLTATIPQPKPCKPFQAKNTPNFQLTQLKITPAALKIKIP